MQTELISGWYTNIDYQTLTADEVHSNGMRFAQMLYNFGWTENSIAGILGNVQPESGLNPGCMESPKPWTVFPSNQEVLTSSYLLGIGFTQWTPGRDKIVQFAEDNNLVWYNGNTQIKRLKWECDNDYQMGGWQWFIHNDGDPADLAEYFLRQYERPSPSQIEQSLAERRRLGTYWYAEIHGKLTSTVQRIMFSQSNRKRKELKRRCLKI